MNPHASASFRALNPPRLTPEARKAAEKFAEKSEKEAHNKFEEFLILRGYKYIHPPMHKRSALPKGWPDFSLSTKRGLSLAIEFKQPAGIVSHDHQKCQMEMIAAGWPVVIVYCAQEAIDLVLAMDGPQ